MISDFSALMLASGVLIPIVIGLVQAFKNAGLTTKMAPFLSVAFGIALEYLASGNIIVEQSWRVIIIMGVFVGLSASGLFSGTKTVLQEPDGE